MHVLLVGMRGAGKSTIGRTAAERLQLPFVDLDDIALADVGCASVREVWETRGESAWREAEARAFKQTVNGPPRIVALGGGAPLIPDVEAGIARRRAAGRALVIYLRVDPAELSRRLRADLGDRPSLTGAAHAADEVAHLLRTREPVYERVADVVIDAAAQPIPAIADAIVAAVAKYRGAD
jgi:shikimate kinase